MKIFSLVIVLSLFSVQTILANAITDKQIKSAVAIGQSSFSPEILKKVKKMAKDKGIIKPKHWVATEYGYILSQDPALNEYPRCHILLTWDGDVFKKCIYNGVKSNTEDLLWTWEDIK